jgi:hypothetical protein
VYWLSGEDTWRRSTREGKNGYEKSRDFIRLEILVLIPQIGDWAASPPVIIMISL